MTVANASFAALAAMVTRYIGLIATGERWRHRQSSHPAAGSHHALAFGRPLRHFSPPGYLRRRASRFSSASRPRPDERGHSAAGRRFY